MPFAPSITLSSIYSTTIPRCIFPTTNHSSIPTYRTLPDNPIAFQFQYCLNLPHKVFAGAASDIEYRYSAKVRCQMKWQK